MSHEKEEARRYFQQAYSLQMNGNLDEAIDLYRKSISLHPTAEAHTFLGWSYSYKGDLKEAIDQCKIAIDLDPDFGNPYNDIGAYMIRMGKFEEAIPWLEMAINAVRYDARHYPHFNLGRVYERGEGVKVDTALAIDYYGRACSGGYPEGCAALRALRNAK